MQLSKRMSSLRPAILSATLADIARMKAVGKTVINLGIGESDFDTPQPIKDAAIRAIAAGHTKYTPVEGIPELRRAIVDKFERENGLSFEIGEVMASCGGKHNIYNFFQAVLDPGDEVIVPAPYWPSFLDMVALSDGVPVVVPCPMAVGYKLTPELLDAHLTPRTRAVVLNSPSNPSGAVYDRDELDALAQVLDRRPEIWVLSDDMYEHIALEDFRFVNILNVRPDYRERTIVCNGVSKAYAMTGWRIGYSAAPAKLTAAMAKLQSQNTSNPTSVSQYAAIAALDGGLDAIRPMTDAFRQRHRYLLDKLVGTCGIASLRAKGAFYVFADIGAAIDRLYAQGRIAAPTDLAFCSYLLSEGGVAVVPGSAFGIDRHMRLSFAASQEKLAQATQAIQRVCA